MSAPNPMARLRFGCKGPDCPNFFAVRPTPEDVDRAVADAAAEGRKVEPEGVARYGGRVICYGTAVTISAMRALAGEPSPWPTEEQLARPHGEWGDNPPVDEPCPVDYFDQQAQAHQPGGDQ